MDLFSDVESEWLWLIAGVLLAILELVVPGYFLIWLAAAAFITALITAVAGVGIAIELLTFAVFSVFTIYAARRWLHYHPIESSDPLMNDRGGRLVGERVVVTQAIDNGVGRVKHGDSEWPARGADAEPGTRLVVTGHDGVTLIVEPTPVPHIEGEPKQLS